MLRAAPAEELTFSVVLPRPNRSRVQVLQAGAAAAVAALVAAISFASSQSQDRSAAQPFRLSPTAGLDRNDEVAVMRQPVAPPQTRHAIAR
jgi:hypothetical protein